MNFFLNLSALSSSISFLPYYIGLALLGAWFSQRPKPSKKFTAGGLFLWLAASVLTFILTVFRSRQLGALSESYFIYSAPLVIVAAAGFFRAVQYMPFAYRISGRWLDLLKKLAQYTQNIYFVHPLLLNLFSIGILHFALKWDTLHPVIFIPIYTVLVFALSAMVSMALKVLGGIASRFSQMLR